ncbi:Protein translocase subunit SecY [Planctomycetes bacterium Pan216]|uniref:Protein translocase subunit SecY n=1 Tax=Kolteria novifilia TaxID=2527975 RepID=A0A518AZM3_9BACT|nr:Protein translocase subunit SecY [Planctomycetes bacterium Pan216]
MSKLITIFKIPELRNKILFTLGMLAIYRLGFWVPLPIVDQVALQAWAERTMGGNLQSLFNQLALFSGTNLSTSTIFGLGIMPYISASIILQLLASVIPALEKLQKEGESGRKKINEYTRYLTVAICLVQSWIWVRLMMSQGGEMRVVNPNYDGFYYIFVSVITMTAGTVFLMWIGEQIDEYGIGNGISLIIMAGIVGRLPNALAKLSLEIRELAIAPQRGIGVEKLILLAILFVFVVVGVVLITQGQRRIPTQSAKHVRGRRVYGGNRQYLPLRVNQAGVMPVIFASSLLMFPSIVLAYLAQWVNWPPLDMLRNSFSGQGFFYIVCYIGLIYFFCYFWTAITFNPKDMANNLKDHGSFIPGYRPGKRTADYLERVMLRITYVGAAFLAVVAIIPQMVSTSLGVPYEVASFFGGTGLLIIISVALDLVQKIDSHLIMRNYDSLLGTAQN